MSEPTRIAGGCACGAVRFECASGPLSMVNCHCRDCQRAGGTAYAPTVIVNADDFVCAAEALRFHEVRAASGNLVRRYFCGQCGAPLFARTSGRNDRVAVRAASLDDSSGFAATRDVWIESALPWDARAQHAAAIPTLEVPSG